MGGKLVRDAGEFGLIHRLQHAPALRHQASWLLVNNGDDAAIWRPTPGTVSVISTDTMIEGVHFTQHTTPWRDLGWKSLAVNISDLAAMAAAPKLVVVTLGLTGNETLHAIDELYAGIGDAAARYDIVVVGGDTVRAPQVQVGFTVVGELPEGPRAGGLSRQAAQPGDVLVVTGTLGDAAAGLELLLSGTSVTDDNPLVHAHRRPIPRVREARWLLDNGVRCATDNSDGLLREAAILADASHLTITIDLQALPLDPALIAYAPENARHLALRGGEEYELVLTASAAAWPSLQRAWRDTFAVPLTAVGRCDVRHSGEPAVRIEGEASWATAGFDHFAAV